MEPPSVLNRALAGRVAQSVQASPSILAPDEGAVVDLGAVGPSVVEVADAVRRQAVVCLAGRVKGARIAIAR